VPPVTARMLTWSHKPMAHSEEDPLNVSLHGALLQVMTTKARI